MQQERQRHLQAVLEGRRLKVDDGYLAAQRYIQGPAAGSEAVAGGLQGLDEAVAAIERRRFIAAHCSAERALALAAASGLRKRWRDRWERRPLVATECGLYMQTYCSHRPMVSPL